LIHFISGLPRSGSTLLAAILRQNPAIEAGMTSPVGSLVLAMQRASSRQNDAAIFMNSQHRERLLRGIFTSYYDPAVYPQPVIFDTNRVWCSKMPLIHQLFPQAKVICCVREVSWVVDSIERIIRRNPLELSGLFGYEAGGTVATRVNALMASNGLVGGSLAALRDAFYSEFADRLMLVDYERLAKDPVGVIRRLYDWLALEPYSHDFSRVEYSADDFDAALGTPGLHTVRAQVEWRPQPSVLPDEVFSRFITENFWRQIHPSTTRATILI
jgi:sulfotransferase